MRVQDSTTTPSNLSQEILFSRITNRIRQSLELPEILPVAVSEVRSFLNVDRVMIYQFHADYSGKVIAEARQGNRLSSLLNLNFPASDIPPAHRELLLKTRRRSLVDVESKSISFSPLHCLETGQILDSVEVHQQVVDPCHLKYLTAMGVRSSLVLPIVHRNMRHPQATAVLWGLLIAHHAEPRSISHQELQVVQHAVDQVSIAIAQSELLQQAQTQAQQEAMINQIVGDLYNLSDLQLQTALEKTVKALQGTGGRLYLQTQQLTEVYTWGQQPVLSKAEGAMALEEQTAWQAWLAQSCTQQPAGPAHTSYCQIYPASDLFEVSELSPLYPAFEAAAIRSMLTILLQFGQQHFGYLTIFRQETCRETVWAGPLQTLEELQSPRQSFEAWREVKAQQADPWSMTDLELSQALGQHFAIAIQQYCLHQQAQTFNLHLEQQIQLRTAELQQSWKVDRALKQISNQIRSTLDLKHLLRTVVQEVQILLKADRVVIYQFTDDWQGQVVIEAIAGDWMSLLDKQYADECFPQGHAMLYQAGRIRVIDDVEHSNLSPCHIQFLQDIQVQANLVVPIRISTKLWGLLITHACQAPRKWHSFEIDLLQQLADQAAIAIHQAELYAKSRQTAEQATAQAATLEEALNELKKTQTQLIQTEKMSSLGQLVAGVAHEINNPVNFIYGNIGHVNQYIQDLLQFIQLFHQNYPEPALEIQEHFRAIDLDFLLQDLPKTLKSMKMGADRIRQIVLSLRNFSRVDEAEKKPVDLHEGLDNTLLILQHRFESCAAAAKIQVVKDYGSLPLVECYPGQLNQVFMNIINNAIDALSDLESSHPSKNSKRPAQQITIRTSHENQGTVLIEIMDNGPGIPEPITRQLFDPFFTTKPVGKGTGLGLSISYQIVVERHGGAIGCDSEPGKGTTFWIRIPIQQHGPQSACSQGNCFNSTSEHSKARSAGGYSLEKSKMA